MGKNSLIKSTSKKKSKASKNSGAATAGKKKAKAAAAPKTSVKKSAPKKAAPKKAVPKKRGTKKAAAAPAKAAAPSKKAVKKRTVAKPTVKELLFKKFDPWTPEKPFRPEGAIPAEFTAPPALTSTDKKDIEAYQELLFRTFDLKAPVKKTVTATAVKQSTATEKKPAAPAREKAKTVAAKEPEAGDAAEKPSAEKKPVPAAEEKTKPEPAKEKKPDVKTDKPAVEEKTAESQEKKEKIVSPEDQEMKPEMEKPAVEKKPPEEAKDKTKTAPEESKKPDTPAEVKTKVDTTGKTEPIAETEQKAPVKKEPPAADVQPKPAKPEIKAMKSTGPKPEAEPVPEVTVTYDEPASLQAKAPSKDMPLKLLAGAVALVMLLLVGASVSNSNKFYLRPVARGMEIWQGKFSPIGKEQLLSLPGAKAPENIESVYKKTDVYPMVASHYMKTADALLSENDIPDFSRIHKILRAAKPFAITTAAQKSLNTRLVTLNMMQLVYKARVAADSGTSQGTAKAAGLLKKAAALPLEPEQSAYVKAHLDKLAQMEKKNEKSQKPAALNKKNPTSAKTAKAAAIQLENKKR